MQKTFTILSVDKIKEGTTNGKKWIMSVVVDENKNRYATLSGDKYAGKINQQVTVEVEERESDKINPRTNKPYVNLSIVEPKKQFNLPTMQQFNDLHLMVQDLQNRVSALEIGRGANIVRGMKEINKQVDDEILPNF